MGRMMRIRRAKRRAKLENATPEPVPPQVDPPPVEEEEKPALVEKVLKAVKKKKAARKAQKSDG